MRQGNYIYIFTRLKKKTGKRNQHTSVCVWCESVSERCCVDQTSLTLFSPNKGFLIGSLWRETFPNHSDYCFIPLHSLPSFFFFLTLSIPVTTPTHPLTTSQPFRRWKELHQTSSCSRAKCPSTTLSSPGYLKHLPPASLIPLNSVFVQLPVLPLSLIYITIHGLLSSACISVCCLSLQVFHL